MSNQAIKQLYCGGEGSGKTVRARHEARSEKRLVTLDVNGTIEAWPEEVIVYNRAQLVAALKSLSGKSFKILYRVDEAREPASLVLDFTARALKAVGGAALFIDETETYVPRSGHKLSDVAYALAKRARHGAPIPLYLTAQKPTELHDVMRNNVSRIVFFDNDEAAAVDYFYKKTRRFLKRAEFDKLLNSLGKFEALEYVRGRKKLVKLKKIKIT